MSKGGTTSGSTEIPAWLESAAIENINKVLETKRFKNDESKEKKTKKRK